ncbi:MAG: putative transcriptional regulator [Cypionkella sp.]|uniref:helix-turn-helix transcriptional regulator n=1 Tax=Cypionkella sp. TaxID=2811411 RepID=UPI00262FC17F|nr:transcriptional regulator [Cypionkella sp.]MDB5659213.1 putative transcriptional regulator [Cypionkella sp.]
MASKLITATVVRETLGGVSDMTLWRWIHDPAMNFPAPVRIQSRRYWHEDELRSWIESRSVSQVAAE